jgi:hypothetical protein
VCRTGATGVVLAGREIDLLLAFFADMLAFEFIGENFNLGSAILTFTDKRFQISEGFKTWTVAAWRIHSVHLKRVK